MLMLILALAAVSAQAAPKVIAVDVDSVIHPITVEIIGHAIDQADHENAAAVLLRMNTPGGLLDATREITSKIVASRVPVIVYVTPTGARGASAGFFVLESADVAAMAPGTNTGASSPVLMNGQMDAVMRSKVENDTSAWLRSIVTKRGRNVELAEETIRKAQAFTEKEALDDHLIDLIAPDERRLLETLDGREIRRFDGRAEVLHTQGAEVSVYQASRRERLMQSIADPNIGYILVVLGALGIYGLLRASAADAADSHFLYYDGLALFGVAVAYDFLLIKDWFDRSRTTGLDCRPKPSGGSPRREAASATDR